MTALIQDTALALLAPGFVGATVAAVRYRARAAKCANDYASLQELLQRTQQLSSLRDQAIRHLAIDKLPAQAAALLNGGDHPSTAAQSPHPELLGTAFAEAEHQILQFFSALTDQASQRAEQAAQSSVRSVTRALQALVYEQQRAISLMLDRHDDVKVLADTYEIDHACSQLARKAQVVGVLAGTWPGRQRDDTPLLDVVRGGVSRIRDYRRVRITGEPTDVVGSRVVEPVVLAIAELLDNAARNSQPGTDVDVWFVHAHNGVSVVIDDAGIGLKPEDRAEAARLLSGREPVRLTELRNPPRLGFLGIGALAGRYGFHASVEQQSDHGGVRAIVHLDRSLLVAAASSDTPGPKIRDTQVQARSTTSPSPVAQASSSSPYPIADDGLPQRRRSKRSHRQPAMPPASQPPTDGGRSLAAFVHGTDGQRPNPHDEENPT
ncbi:ATP-binding protein [Streptomyces sp. NPDC048508]|uniref:ATP-binding protein n=1 Tax=Streptomyces sp. NPDC048508 TaxID=3365561 RepID=UPI003714D796